MRTGSRDFGPGEDCVGSDRASAAVTARRPLLPPPRWRAAASRGELSSVIHLTRLETRTKESNTCASLRVF